ncbi:MAG: V-type ATPase subunit [Lachnospiraceae bacterium]|nr:V-type ATPase subunit [Lachnospiraceae bacterium]
MAENQYIYAVARIRAKENSLLKQQTLDQLMSCKTVKDCTNILTDYGWDCEDKTPEQFLSLEREKTWSLMREMVEDMSVFNIFLYPNDFHNLKAAIKQVYLGKEIPAIFMKNATVDPVVVLKAVTEKDFSLLPESMRECADKAYDILFKTGDSQMMDTVVDKYSLEALYKSGKESKNELFATYAEMKVVAANINVAIRSAKTKKPISFLKEAFVACDTLDIKALTEASLAGLESIYAYLENTAYHDAIQAIRKSPSAFECWCDNKMMDLIRPQKYNPFTISPLAAYVLARENELKSVRIILSGKLNGLPEEAIRERMREMYV